jgi:preprotein translocase subunit YajC
MFRRNKKEQQARASLKKGDRVVSQSGLVGELVEMEERFAKVKLGPGNTVTMLTSSVQPLDPVTAAPKAADKDLKDLKDAKVLAEKK